MGRACKLAIAALVGVASVIAAERAVAQEPGRDPGGCHGAVISALATSGFQPGDAGDVAALHDKVRSACAALDPQVQRFTVEIEGVTVGGVIEIRLVPAD